ncbi:hypothetical protein, partial [Enterobacter intestinihominis]
GLENARLAAARVFSTRVLTTRVFAARILTARVLASWIFSSGLIHTDIHNDRVLANINIHYHQLLRHIHIYDQTTKHKINLKESHSLKNNSEPTRPPQLSGIPS